jgi:outer membrane protein, heavy metal efflux system
LSVSVPLGTKSRSRYAVAETDAQIVAIESRRQARIVEERQQLFERYQELLHAKTEYDAVRKKMLPKAEQAVAFTHRGFNEGRFSFVMLSQAEKTLFDLRARAVEASARYHMLLVDIERLTHVSADTTP